MKKNLFYLFLFLSLFFFLGSFCFFIMKKDDFYELKKNADVKVTLKPNSFYQTDILTKQTLYPSKSVLKSEIHFQYDFQSKNSYLINYQYQIEFELIGMTKDIYGEEKEIWTKTIPYEETKKEAITTNFFTLSKDISFDYSYYQDLVSSYESLYHVDLNAILKIKMPLTYQIASLEEKKDTLEIDIPIHDTILEFDENYEPVTKEEISSPPFFLSFGLGFCFFILSLFLIPFKKKKIEEKINHFCREYKEYLVFVNHLPNDSSEKILVSHPEDLIVLAIRNHTHVVCEKERKMCFVFLKNTVYFYSFLLDETLEKKGRKKVKKMQIFC